MFKKLGFDSSNYWILYDDQFDKFFNFLAENITNSNIFTMQELVERPEMQLPGEWALTTDRLCNMNQIEYKTGILRCSSIDLHSFIAHLEVIKKATHNYNTQLEHMQEVLQGINNNLSDLDCELFLLHNVKMEILIECQVKACQLDKVHHKNCKLREDANKVFTTRQVPPLFVHQLSLEHYFLKCDSFMQYFNLYVGDNFKMEDVPKFVCVQRIIFHKILENLQNSFQYYTLAYIKENAKVRATQVMMDQLNLNIVHCTGLLDIVRAANDFQILNENLLKDAHCTLQTALTFHVQQHIQQSIEFVLCENTKQKLERAVRRRKNDNRLTRVISDALSNSELIWIAAQLDLEKKNNSCDNSIILCAFAQTWQRTHIMRSLNSTRKGISAQFMCQLSRQLSVHLCRNVRYIESKSYLYEYEKFSLLFSHGPQSIRNTMFQMYVHELLTDLKHFKKTLCPFVFDAPLQQPMLENVRHFCTMFNIVEQQRCFEDLLRNLRTQFKESIMDRMEKEKLWRLTKILWILFLTDPQRMLIVINEVKRSSANVSATISSVFRTSGGLHRK